MYFSHLAAAGIAALGLLPKAALETWFFHDKVSAGQTLKLAIHTDTLLSHDSSFAGGRQLGGPENKIGGKQCQD